MNSSLSNKMAVGGMSGFIGLSVVYPIDTIRARLQYPVANMFTALYKGIGFTSMCVVPEKALKFGVNDWILDDI